MLALVVDDSKPIRSIVAQTLRSLRFDCLEAANGVEALEVLAKCKRPDLVMVNWHMPVMDGIELIRQLRQHPTHRSLRLLMISLAITPARQIFNLPRLILVRRMVGVAAFAYAVFHLTTYAADQMFNLWTIATEIVLRYYLTIGFGVLLTLGALTATSTDAMLRRMGGKKWRRLHRLAYVAGFFAIVHFFMQTKLNISEPIVMAGYFTWLMAFRFLAWRIGSRKAGSPVVLAALAVTVGIVTALGEAAYYGLFTRFKSVLILQANLNFDNDLRPAWTVLIAGLAVALAALLRWAVEKYRSSGNGRPISRPSAAVSPAD